MTTEQDVHDLESNLSAEIDALYLFACTLAWQREGNELAGRELSRALASSDVCTQLVARSLVLQSLPGICTSPLPGAMDKIC